MTVDFMPTFVALASAAGAKVSLPSDRTIDGVDLSEVLLDGSNNGHTTLFHPHGAGNSTRAVPAMRYKQYKAFFETSGAGPCRMANGSHLPSGKTLTHDPPLMFDLDADPAESTPIDPNTIPDIIVVVQTEYAKFWASVASGLISTTNFSSGGNNYRACGNISSCCCRTHRPFVV
jgi:hypothetical protein